MLKVDAKADRQVSVSLKLNPKLEVQSRRENVTRMRVSGAMGVSADEINGEYLFMGKHRHSKCPYWLRTHYLDGSEIQYHLDEEMCSQAAGDKLAGDTRMLGGAPFYQMQHMGKYSLPSRSGPVARWACAEPDGSWFLGVEVLEPHQIHPQILTEACMLERTGACIRFSYALGS